MGSEKARTVRSTRRRRAVGRSETQTAGRYNSEIAKSGIAASRELSPGETSR